MLSKSHFQVISHLINGSDPELSVGALADQVEWSASHASRIISELEAYGCVQTNQSGREKLVSLTEIESIEQLEALLTEYRHMDLPALIAASGLPILYYLEQGRTATELAERSSVSQVTVYRRLDDLQLVGITGKSKSRYRLNEPFTVLVSIARGLFHQKHRREAGKHAAGLNFLWEIHDEYLFACDSDISAEGFHLTGPTLFGEFGVLLLTRDRRHYLRTDRISEVDPVELVCHALLIDDGSRYRTYCLLLIQKQDIDRTALRERAEHYHPEATIDLPGIVDGLIEYVETSGETTAESLPKWEEFKQTAREYEGTL